MPHGVPEPAPTHCYPTRCQTSTLQLATRPDPSSRNIQAAPLTGDKKKKTRSIAPWRPTQPIGGISLSQKIETGVPSATTPNPCTACVPRTARTGTIPSSLPSRALYTHPDTRHAPSRRGRGRERDGRRRCRTRRLPCKNIPSRENRTLSPSDRGEGPPASPMPCARGHQPGQRSPPRTRIIRSAELLHPWPVRNEPGGVRGGEETAALVPLEGGWAAQAIKVIYEGLDMTSLRQHHLTMGTHLGHHG